MLLLLLQGECIELYLDGESKVCYFDSRKLWEASYGTKGSITKKRRLVCTMRYCLTQLARLGLTLQVLKTAFAAGLAWLVALLIPGSSYPVFAPLAAILTMQVTIADSIEKGVYRVLGVIVGVTVGGAIGSYFAVNTVTIFFAILLGISASTAFRLNPQITSQVGVSTLLVLVYGQTSGYMLGRIWETMIGSLVAVLLNIAISPPQASVVARQAVVVSIRQLMLVLEHMLDAPTDTEVSLLEARQMVTRIEKEHMQIIQTAHGFRYTPFQRRERKAMFELVLLINRVEHISIQIRGIARSLVDLHSLPGQTYDFSSVLKDVRLCLLIFARAVAANDAEAKEAAVMAVREMRANFSQYYYALQHEADTAPEVGAIFSDLGRILDEIEDKFPALNAQAAGSGRLFPGIDISANE
ncbi:Aromatic acid exporter family member 1 [Propionispora vibrioides]|uniref:Aromatic acid exporter family member 1 n=2 Tax=Propionispora vibrioides TaxID=112903 RepID=A0A1H8UPK4_9FIRM|nr:Aromatic acid exporter family member 1 [Propionispora vibrioides]